MADQEWLENLATAVFDGKDWRLPEPERAQSTANRRLNDAMSELLQEARDATDMFNLSARLGAEIQLLKLSSLPGDDARGFLLVLGTHQIKVSQTGLGLHADLTLKAGFRTKSAPLYRLKADFDVFGGLTWRLEKTGEALDYERIVKGLIECLCRVYFAPKGQQ